MLCSIPADTVNAAVFKVCYHSGNYLLYILMLRVEVRHTDVAVSYLPAVAPVDIFLFCIEFSIVIELIALEVIKDICVPSAVCPSCKVIGNNVNDNLHAVLMCLCAESLEVISGAEVIAYRESERLIEPVPDALAVMRLNG